MKVSRASAFILSQALLVSGFIFLMEFWGKPAAEIIFFLSLATEDTSPMKKQVVPWSGYTVCCLYKVCFFQ